KRWIVRKDTVSASGNASPVTTYACYLPRHQKAWSGSLAALRTALIGYGALVGPYPYPSMAAVDGGLSAGGGMEYPMVTVIAASRSADRVNTVIIHEAGHNWFYGVLGSNERDHPWLDEGLNSFYEQKFDADAQVREGKLKLDG